VAAGSRDLQTLTYFGLIRFPQICLSTPERLGIQFVRKGNGGLHRQFEQVIVSSRIAQALEKSREYASTTAVAVARGFIFGPFFRQRQVD
jgi:hypothetical protein